MATIKEWFETKDYLSGITLLIQYSKNRALINALSRKHYPEKLAYELKKLLPFESVTEVAPMFIQKHSHSDMVIDLMNSELPAERLKVVRNDRTISFEELPRELQARWTQNRDSYKEIRSFHEKLKLMDKATPKERSLLTGRIAHLDDVIRGNWEVIDGWNGTMPTTQNDGVIGHKRIGANRKFICTNLKKLPKQADPVKIAKTITEMQLRYDELKAAREELALDTLAQLQKSGIKF